MSDEIGLADETVKYVGLAHTHTHTHKIPGSAERNYNSGARRLLLNRTLCLAHNKTLDKAPSVDYALVLSERRIDYLSGKSYAICDGKRQECATQNRGWYGNEIRIVYSEMIIFIFSLLGRVTHFTGKIV